MLVDDGHSEDGTPKFRIVAEGVDWSEHVIRGIEVKHWPKDTALAIDLPGNDPFQAAMYQACIEWKDLSV